MKVYFGASRSGSIESSDLEFPVHVPFGQTPEEALEKYRHWIGLDPDFIYECEKKDFEVTEVTKKEVILF